MVIIEREEVKRAYVLTPDILGGMLTPEIEYVWVSPCTYADIRKWGRDIYTIESESNPASLKIGFMGTFRGAKIYMSRGIPDDCLALVHLGEPNLVRNQVGRGQVFYKWLDEAEVSWEVRNDTSKVPQSVLP